MNTFPASLRLLGSASKGPVYGHGSLTPNAKLGLPVPGAPLPVGTPYGWPSNWWDTFYKALLNSEGNPGKYPWGSAAATKQFAITLASYPPALGLFKIRTAVYPQGGDVWNAEAVLEQLEGTALWGFPHGGSAVGVDYKRVQFAWLNKILHLADGTWH